MMKQPKVLIVMPCGENVKSTTVGHLGHLLISYPPGMISFGVCEGATAATQNTACETIKNNKQFTHLMLIDSDQTFPPTILEALIRRDKDIVGIPYRARYDLHQRFHFPLDLNNPDVSMIRPIGEDPGDRRGLVPVAALPSGLMLIKRMVIDVLSHPYFFMTYGDEPKDDMSNDINFCLKARAKGFRVYADLDLAYEVGHLAQEELRW
jgi:hypothetical protein